MAGLDVDLAGLAQFRGEAYLLLGSLFYYPEDEQVGKLAAAASAVRSYDELALGYPFFPLWRELVENVAELDDVKPVILQEQYNDLFLATADRNHCPLNESAHLDSRGQLRGWIVSQVESSYSAGGFALSEEARGELPDHVGLELEYMSLLCQREGDGRRDEDGDGVSHLLTLEKAFIDQHLNRLLPFLEASLIEMATDGSIYGHLARASRAFVSHDSDLTGLLLESLDE